MVDKIVSRLKALVREVGHLERPAVGILEPEIRSGDKFLLRDPFSGKADATGAGNRARERLRANRAIGAIIVEWGYDVRNEDISGFLEFLHDNEVTLLDPAYLPSGVRYKGTYSVFSSTEKHTGHFRTIWAYRGFGDLDALSNEYETGSTFASLVQRLRGYADNGPGAARSQQIYLLASSSRPTDR
jgi:hypothetical protein